MSEKKITEDQLPKRFIDIIETEKEIWGRGASVTQKNKIPDTTDIPIENPSYWIKIPDIIAVVVDMKGSTKLSASTHERSTAKTYRLFTSTAIKLFHEFEARYIDIKGDGVFALFDSDQAHTALASAVTFKTFCEHVFIPKTKEKTEQDVGVRIGVDCKSVLVRKFGLKRNGGRSDRQNEVWAGKPVNMAFKLSSLSEENEIFASNRYYNLLKNELVRKSCGCPDGVKKDLWEKVDVSQKNLFDFDIAYKLKSCWCFKHGKEFCDKIIGLDNK